MKLSRPAAPFERVELHGESFTLDTSGKVLVLPSGDPDVLPSFNEYVLNSNRLTIAESPFGGLKGAGSPDYAPGTLYTPTDGVYLTDVAGNNSTKTLTAGKLKELNLLTVNTTAHTITEEFIVANTATSNNPTVINSGDSSTNVSMTGGDGSGTISIENGQIKIYGTSSVSGWFRPKITTNLTGLTATCISFEITSDKTCTLRFSTFSGAAYKLWAGARWTITANTKTKFVLPLNAPQGITGMLPDTVSGTYNTTVLDSINLGIGNAGNSAACTIYLDNIQLDTAKSAYVELQTPDNLSDSSLQFQVFDGSAYQTTGVYKLDSTYSAVSTTTANWKLSDGTKFDDCYGSGNGRALFPKGASAETKAGSTGSITYSANKGTRNRIGFRIDLPPSDGGRTNFNKVRLKITTYYTDTVGNIVPDLSGNNNTGTIVGGVTKLNDGGLQFDGSTGYVDCGTSPNLHFTTPFSIVASIKIPVAPSTMDTMIFSDYNAAYKGYKFNITDDRKARLQVGRQSDSSVLNAVSSQTLSLDTWYHIVGIYDGARPIIYVNAEPTAAATFSPIEAESGECLIGKNRWVAVYSNSFINSLKVYNRALTSAEVTADYSNQSVSSTGLVLHYNPTVSNMGSTTHQFADSTNTSYGLQNLSKPWIALYSPTDSLIDFYLFTHRPQSLNFKRDETGTIHELNLYPGAGSVYHGQITFADLTLDTNSDSVPDCLEAAVNGSVTKFLQNYSMVI